MFKCLFGTFFLVLSVMANAFGEVVKETEEVRGAAPVVSGVVIRNNSTRYPTTLVSAPDNELEVSYTFTDSDGDLEEGTSFQWISSREGEIEGATSKKFIVPGGGEIGDTFSVRVTPRTSPETTLPYEGDGVVSSESVLGTTLRMYVPFMKGITPSPVTLSFEGAKNICESQGHRLPTEAELREYIGYAQRVLPNAQYSVCYALGWPIPNSCGGRNPYQQGIYRTDNKTYGVNTRSAGWGLEFLSTSYDYGLACVID